MSKLKKIVVDRDCCDPFTLYFPEDIDIVVNKRLYVMVGVPGSGKSTYARTERKDSVRVNQDDIRMMFSGEQYDPDHNEIVALTNHNIVVGLMENSVEGIVVDNTNLTRDHYEKYRVLADEYGYNVVYVVMNTYHDTSRIRNSCRGASVPQDVFDKFTTMFDNMVVFLEGEVSHE